MENKIDIDRLLRIIALKEYEISILREQILMAEKRQGTPLKQGDIKAAERVD